MKKILLTALVFGSIAIAHAGIDIVSAVTFHDHDESARDKAFAKMYTNAYARCANELGLDISQVQVSQTTPSASMSRLWIVTISAHFDCRAK
jgi:hypothetical protein